MATTPESWVKKSVKELLDHWVVYYHMPMQNGMGKPSLDFIVCTHGQFLAIETKAPGKFPTRRQQDTMNAIKKAGGQVVMVGAWAGLELLWRKVSDSRSAGAAAWPPVLMPANLQARWMRYFRNAGAKDAHQHAT